jgi:hypothetical protein
MAHAKLGAVRPALIGKYQSACEIQTRRGLVRAHSAAVLRHQSRCRSNFATRFVARKTTAVGKSHGGRAPQSSFRNVRTRRLPTLVHFAFLNLTRFLRWLGRRRHGGLLWRPWPGGIDHTARLYPQSQNCRVVSRLTVHHGELHALVSRSGRRQVRSRFDPNNPRRSKTEAPAAIEYSVCTAKTANGWLAAPFRQP